MATLAVATPTEYYYEYVTVPEGEEEPLAVAVPTLYFLLFALGLVGNGLVLLVLRWSRGGRRLVDTFVVHLAVADLVFVLMLPLWALSAARRHHWDFGEPLCRLSSYVLALNRFSTVALLACMSADRYLAVVRQLDSRFLRSSRCVRLTCALVWSLAALLAGPALFFRRVDALGVCSDPEESAAFQAYALLTLLLAFVLPVAVILLCYGAICLHLQRHCALTTNPRTHARRRHTLKMVLAIVSAFVASWLPFAVCRAALSVVRLLGVELGAEQEAGLKRALLLSSCLAFVNSCANPAIYLLLDRTFRRRTMLLIHACLGHRLPAQDSLSHSHTHTTQTNDSRPT
ncbi:hypothetical protein ACEWY4_013462 [Coilia grayii]|uniref:G-protein coupled receptors family 1 profile domain-containing protein n=1 Tax=Coilia grayii TaxID=363190 RepID=A0ABD1JWI4_9TELE